LVVTPAGELLIADANNSSVRQVSRDGTIVTIAGRGSAGLGGDGGAATSALLSYPLAVAVEPAGSVLIADNGNNRIRRVDHGSISTAAGNGTAGYSGDGGPATSAEFNEPVAVAAHGTDVFIADAQNSAIRRVDSSGVVVTVLGSGDGLRFPGAVVVDSRDEVLVADTWRHQVLRVSPDGRVTIVAGTGAPGYSGDGGPANRAEVNAPEGLAVGPNDEIYVSDSGNGLVRLIDVKGTITTVAGSRQAEAGAPGHDGSATETRLREPAGIAVDASGFYVAERGGALVRHVDRYGRVTTVAGTGSIGYGGEGRTGSASLLNHPTSVAIDKKGELLIADTGNCLVRRIDARTGALWTIAGFTPVRGLRPVCGYTGQGGGNGMLDDPTGLAVDHDGRILIADSLSNRVRLLSA
jgi:sugar lactone lactonase YvrE